MNDQAKIDAIKSHTSKLMSEACNQHKHGILNIVQFNTLCDQIRASSAEALRKIESFKVLDAMTVQTSFDELVESLTTQESK